MSSDFPLIPDDEPGRLEALSRYKQLGTPGEALLQELVRLTARLFDVPIALVSLVEESTVFFAGNVGLPGGERVGRHESLCSVAILQEETTVFGNLGEEPCALVDPYLTRSLNLKFYAGHPLRTPDGFAIGTLCVIDRQTRVFSPEQQTLLTALAAGVMHLLELRARLAQDPHAAPVFWTAVYERIMPSLTRLQTLDELGRWETTSETDAAQAYRTSAYEEAALIVRTLDEEITTALERLS